MAAEAGHADHVEVEVPVAPVPTSGAELSRDSSSGSVNTALGVGAAIVSPQHRHPMDAPGDDAARGDEVGEAVVGREPDLLDAASGLEGLEEGLDAPAPRMPAELPDGVFVRRDREVGDRLPEQRRPIRRRVRLLGVDDPKLLIPFEFPFSDRGPGQHRGEFHGQKCLPVPA